MEGKVIQVGLYSKKMGWKKDNKDGKGMKVGWFSLKGKIRKASKKKKLNQLCSEMKNKHSNWPRVQRKIFTYNVATKCYGLMTV